MANTLKIIFSSWLKVKNHFLVSSWIRGFPRLHISGTADPPPLRRAGVPRSLVVWLYRQLTLKPFFLSKLWAILVPNEIECLNSLISKGLLESSNFMEEEKVTFFVSKNNYLVTIISLTYCKRFEMLYDEPKMDNYTFGKKVLPDLTVSVRSNSGFHI